MRFEEIRGLPTVMRIEQEISVIRCLMATPFDALAANREAFSTLVWDLQTSHTDGGVFELTRENESEFFQFADWLETINRQFGAPVIMEAIIDNFRISYDDAVHAFGPPSPSAGGKDAA